ncbi:hypothetical protein F4775DRAFT_276947 [Biscogniauxia sp. FL1348]|nr:hypothetical protein F4775DRAFT_276947 [Biscogniauxia sp. FL1348]
MVTTTTTSHIATDESQYYYLPNADSQEVDLQGYGWMEPIVIDDEDLMFGGKSLSAWYEEERQTYSCNAAEEEERRGRQRVRQHHHSHSHNHNHHRSDAPPPLPLLLSCLNCIRYTNWASSLPGCNLHGTLFMIRPHTVRGHH